MEILELNGRVRMDQPIYRETVFCRGQKDINRAVPCVSICFLFIYVSPRYIEDAIIVHPVPPFAAEQGCWPYIVEAVADRIDKVNQKLVVTQIDFHQTTVSERPTSSEWSVLLLPATASRSDVLAEAEIEEFCEHTVEHRRCLLWHHNQLWPEQDDPHAIQDGDFLHIAVPPRNDDALESTAIEALEAYEAAHSPRRDYSNDGEVDTTLPDHGELPSRSPDDSIRRGGDDAAAPSDVRGPTNLYPEEVWIAMLSAYREVTEPLPVVLYGLCGETVGTGRYQVPSLNHHHLEHAAHQVWPHLAHHRKNLILVTPQPKDDDRRAVHILVEFMDQNDQPHPRVVPVLEDLHIWKSDGSLEDIRQAVYHHSYITLAKLFHGFGQWCESDHQYYCNAWARDRPLLQDGPYLLQPGDLVTLRLSPKRPEEMAWVTERFPNAPAFYHQVVQQSATSSVTDPKWTLFLETAGAGTTQAVYQPRWHGHHSPSAVLETYRTGLQAEGPLEIYFVPYLYVSHQELVFVAHLATDPNEVCYLSYVVQTPGGIEEEGVRSISIPPTTSFEELLMTVGFPRWTSSTTCAVTLLRDGLPVDDTGGVHLRSGNCLQLTISIADWHQLARDLTLIGVTPTASRSEAAEAESTSLLQIGVHRRKFPLLLAPHLDTETNHKVVQFPLDLHHVTSFLGAWQQMPLNQPEDIPEEVELQSITRQALQLQAGPNQERHTHIFTDGSFDATTGTMAWSFVVIETGTFDYAPTGLKECLGFACGLVDTDHLSPNWKGAERANAYVAEMEALLQAQWWSISNNTGESVHFHFDAQSAGYAAGGRWGYDPTHKLCVLTRVIAQCLELYTPSTPQYHYVQAHAGDPWNELADTVANACRGGSIPPTHAPAFDFRPLLMGSYVLPVEHLPLTLQVLNGHTGLPSGTGHQLHFESSLGRPATSEALWPLDIQDHCTSTTTTTTMTATLRCGTYNVRTLREERTLPPTGAAEYLRTQLTLLQYHVCALQETRAKESTMIEASDFIRLIAAGERGQGGCELWFSKQQSFGGHEKCGVQHLTVLHQEPSLLVVRQRISNDFVIYVNVHAPHSGHSEETRDQWWAKLQGVLDHVRHRGRIILLGDFNAQLGESLPNVVGDLIDGKTTSNGHKLGELLMRYDLWMPSTYRHCHSGPIGTWIHPKAKTAIRIDYIALDGRLAAYNVISEVEHHLDSPGLGEDHYPVRLDFSFVVRHTTGKRKRALIDEVALGDPQHRFRVTQILQQLPTIPWNENVHDHYASIASALHQQLSDAFPQQRKQPRKHYISQATWLCRSSKLALKKALSAARKRKDEVTEALLLQQLQGASNQLRRQLQADRQNHVDLLFDQIDKVPHNQLFAQLQRLGIGARFKKTARTLPMMKKENGEYATSYEESQQVWRQHASALEGGRNIEGVELLHQCEARQRDQLRDGLCPHGLHIPTRVQVERACRKLRPFKARGPDGLPAGLYHHFPEVMAQLLHPLLVKMSCLGAEPLGFKGGRLVHLYKGKGAQDDVANRRGILISNHASKIAHGVLRGQYTPFLEAGMLPMQVGGRAHKSVQQGAHMLRLFMDTCKQQNLACGVVFLDIRTAYYKVLRELVATIHAPEERLRALIDTFSLPSEALQELESKLKASTPIAAQLGTNPYMTSMLGELHSDTWFSTQGLEGVTVTTIGARPGSCFADILFNILFAAVLKETKEQLGELGVMTDLQWNGLKSLMMDNTDHAQEVTIVESAWADDLALFFQHSDPETLVNNVQEGSTVLLNNCMRYGLEPNFSAGKTEALVSLRGRGATKARRKWFTDHHGLLPLPSCLLPDCCIKMVARYKHLGGVVDAKAKSTPEVRARVGQMRQAFRKYRKTLFVVPSISRSKRAQLLRPFVLSILEYNLGTLTGLHDGDRQYIATALLSIYKQIMKGGHTDDHKLAWPRLCYALQLPTPTAIVYMAQLRYFSQIYRHGDEALWALISTQGQWLISCQEAFQWLYQQVENTTTLPDPLVDWEPWGHLDPSASLG